MIPVTQTKVNVKKSNGEIIVRGNCFAAVVASILEIPIDEVPNVEVLFFLDGNRKFYWSEVMQTFLNGKGWELCNDYRYAVLHDENFGISENSFYNKEQSLEYCKDKYYLVSGKSKRGVYHVCIYRNGLLVHDPHPTKEGILTFENFETLEKINSIN